MLRLIGSAHQFWIPVCLRSEGSAVPVTTIPHILGSCSPQSSYLGPSSCFLCLGLKVFGEIPHVYKLLSYVCSAVLQRMGPCPRSDGRWRSYSPRQESQDRWQSFREKKVDQSISSARWRFSCHFCSDRFTFHREETVRMIWRLLALQRLSNMANVHACTVPEYCFFPYLWVMNKGYILLVKYIWYSYCSGYTFWSSSLSTRAFFPIT